MIPYGKQSIDDDDIAAVVAALRSDYLTTGPEVEAFEREFAAFVGAKHAIAVCNATAALHLAMLVADIGPGDRVVTSPNTFLASANCAAYVGATPDFSDIDPDTYNLCPKTLEANWQSDTKAVVAVDYAGRPCDMPEIARVAREHGAIVIEDACHGTGGGFMHEGKFHHLGGHPWADMTTFSFHPVKTLTTGEGGMLVTDNDDYAQRARMLRSHGVVRDAEDFTVFVDRENAPADMGYGIWDIGEESSPPISSEPASEYPNSSPACGTNIPSPLFHSGPWTYEMQALGYNYRITDFQCALGRSQLRKLPRFIQRRQEIVDHYNAAFRDLPWMKAPKSGEYTATELPGYFPRSREGDSSAPPTGYGEKRPTPISSEPASAYPISSEPASAYPISHIPRASGISYHLYTLQIDFPALGKTRSEVMHELREQGIGTQVLYIPVYLQPWYQQTYGYTQGKCPNAEAYYLKALSLPLYPSMTDEDVQKVIQAVLKLRGKTIS